MKRGRNICSTFARAAFSKPRRAALAIAALALLGAAGCAGTRHGKPDAEAESTAVWPPPPDAPRIAHVQNVRGPADLGVKVSSLTRFGRWLTGGGRKDESFIKPFGIALDEQENLCLTDTGTGLVCFYDREHRRFSSWDRVGPVRFAAPVAVAKRNGAFYVADSALASVISFDQSGKLLARITNHLERPSGLVIANNHLFVADSQRHKIVSFDLGGAFQYEFGKRGVGPGEFNFPTHIAADAEGSLYVTDSMNSRVQIFDGQGHLKGKIGSVGDSTGSFGRPKGVAIDSFGHVYVLDALFDNLQVFDPAGRLLLSFGETGAGKGQFWLPNGIVITRSNEIYVADSYNRRLQVFKYVGPL